MPSPTFRYHATKIVNYSIRALLVLIPVIFVLFWLSMSGALGSEPPDHEEQIFGILLFVAVAPAQYAVRLLAMLGASSGFVGWMISFVVVPLFWGGATYALVQLSRRLMSMTRSRLTKRWSERPAASVPRPP
jgi:hypothetical protein